MSNSTEYAYFAGGCFWCTEAIFESLKGVLQVESGYAGGNVNDPNYEQVSRGHTGHAETIKITFDPTQISYADLLQVFFATHDATSKDRQGADVGTQYRSAIFYSSPAQKELAEKQVAQIAHATTIISPLDNFFTAEQYHQDYYKNHADLPYCSLVITPKLKHLREKFSNMLK